MVPIPRNRFNQSQSTSPGQPKPRCEPLGLDKRPDPSFWIR